MITSLPYHTMFTISNTEMELWFVDLHPSYIAQVWLQKSNREKLLEQCCD